MDSRELDMCISYMKMSSHIESLKEKMTSLVSPKDAKDGLSSWISRVQSLANLYTRRYKEENNYILVIIPVNNSTSLYDADLLDMFPHTTQLQPYEGNIYLLVTEEEYKTLLPLSYDEEKWFFLCEIRIVRDYHTQYGEYADLDI